MSIAPRIIDWLNHRRQRVPNGFKYCSVCFSLLITGTYARLFPFHLEPDRKDSFETLNFVSFYSMRAIVCGAQGTVRLYYHDF
jgi:hypothetical protein